MTTRTELSEIISNGENSGVEFKRDDLRSEDLAKELVAFSNFHGGMVILGVEDTGTITGLTRDNLEEWVMNVCRDKIRPAITPYFERVSAYGDGKDIAIVRVDPGFDVHTLWHKSTNRFLIRVGTQSREATKEEISRLFQQRGTLRAEKRPVSGATLSDLDLRRLRNYFVDIRQQGVPADDDTEAWQSLLVNTEIMTDRSVTVGGLLMFGNVPNRFLPHAGIDAVAYPGQEKDYDARERATLRGPMLPLLSDTHGIIESGLVEQTQEFVQRNTRGMVESDGGRRSMRPAYHPDAVREAVVNALIHRDYLLTSTDIELSVYADRLEVISPGRLPNGVTPDRMRAGIRATRNELLKDIMRDYNYLEHMGMGIPRKIIRLTKEHNGTEVDLIETDERFMVRLYTE